jgi:His-Xaa-Ser system protein HxsD
VNAADDQAAPRERLIELDLAIYPLEVIQKSLYWLSQRAAGKVSTAASGTVSVKLVPREVGVNADEIESEFYAHLADFSVRSQVDAETRSIRELIFTKALAASGALEDPPPGDDRDPVERASDSTHGGPTD